MGGSERAGERTSGMDGIQDGDGKDGVCHQKTRRSGLHLWHWLSDD